MSQQKSIPGLKTTYVVKKEGTGSRVIQARDTVTVHATGVVVVRCLTFVLVCKFPCSNLVRLVAHSSNHKQATTQHTTSKVNVNAHATVKRHSYHSFIHSFIRRLFVDFKASPTIPIQP